MQQIDKDFRMVSEWIPTAENNLGDALSREGDPVQRDKFDEYLDRLENTPTRCHVRAECFEFAF